METLPQVLLPKSSLLRFTRYLMTPEIVACQAPLSMGILQARKLEWVAIFSSRDHPNQGSNPCLLHCRQILYHWDTWQAYLSRVSYKGLPVMPGELLPWQQSLPWQWLKARACTGFLCPQSLTETSALPEHQPNLPWGCLTSPRRSLRIPGCLALGEWSHHCGYLGHEDLFCIALLCILATSS